MEKNESMKRFLRKEVAAASAELMYQAMAALQTENKADTVKKFIDRIKECLCDERICFIQISLVHHRTLLRKPFYQLQAFGPELYLTPPLYEKDLEWEWLYRPYYEFCQRISDESKKYVMQIHKKDLNEICLLELYETKQVVRKLFSESTPSLLLSKDLCAFGAKTGLQIQLSDYMGPYEPLFTFSQRTDALGEWMNGILQNDGRNRI